MEKLEEHRILADFVGVNEELVKQAAERSRPLLRTNKVEVSLDLHLPKLSMERKEDYVRRLLSEDVHSMQSELKRELRKLGKHRQPNYLGGDVCYDDLVNAAKRETQLEVQRIKEEKEYRRKEYLVELGKRENELLGRGPQGLRPKRKYSFPWLFKRTKKYFLAV